MKRAKIKNYECLISKPIDKNFLIRLRGIIKGKYFYNGFYQYYISDLMIKEGEHLEYKTGNYFVILIKLNIFKIKKWLRK